MKKIILELNSDEEIFTMLRCIHNEALRNASQLNDQNATDEMREQIPPELERMLRWVALLTNSLID